MKFCCAILSGLIFSVNCFFSPQIKNNKISYFCKNNDEPYVSGDLLDIDNKVEKLTEQLKMLKKEKYRLDSIWANKKFGGVRKTYIIS